MAKITLAGRVGNVEDLKLVNTANGERKVLSFSAADMKAREGEDPWYRVSIWDTFAEKMAPYIKKGVTLLVEGSLNVRTYEGKNGTSVSKEINRPEITLMSSRTENSASETKPAPATSTQASVPADNVDDGFMNIPDGVDEELPFN